MPRCVIIHGCTGTPAHLYVTELMELYGCTSIVTDWVPGESVADNTLILTDWDIEAFHINTALAT